MLDQFDQFINTTLCAVGAVTLIVFIMTVTM